MARTNSLSIRISAILAATLVAGCAYHGHARFSTYQPTVQSNTIPDQIAYRTGSSRLQPVQIAQGPTTYHIDVVDAVDGYMLALLENSSTDIVVNVPTDGWLAEPWFDSHVKSLDAFGNALIDVELGLELSRGAAVHRYVSHGSVSYSPPASATILNLLTGLSIFLLAPVTIPAMVQTAGNAATALAEAKIPELVRSIEKDLALRPPTSISPSDASPLEVVSIPGRSLFETQEDAVVIVKCLSSQGTGFYVDANSSKAGWIITNAHVIDTGAEIWIQSRDGATARASTIAIDEQVDLALLETNLSPISTLDVTQTPPLAGIEVLAIGTPRGLGWSLSKGVLSAIRRVNDVEVVQVDCALSPGSSGGPIIDTATGQVVGLTSFKLHPRKAEGLNFGISSSEILGFLEGGIPGTDK